METRGGRVHRRPLGEAALSPILRSPFEGPHGAADHEMLFKLLWHAEGCDSVIVDQDEEEAAERAILSMVRAAVGHADHAQRG
ncbi:hypothetical protein [Microbispora triticiradicis]|uniref:hypothetical protein n=1 Tax=Microbispora triticiradicis TaxID=2200763 RepID=UPI001AD6C569|nr:hypothetical protein [Microbispora triticiradicis]